MRKLVLPALLAGVMLSAAPFVRADDPRVVIEKAIKAHGGAGKLAKLKAVKAKAKGIVHIGADVPFTLETVWQEPDRLKNTVNLEGSKQTTTLIEAIAGDEGWSIRDGKPGR